MPNIRHATFTSVWDGGYEITAPCTVDMDTREVITTERVEVGNCVETLDYEYITVDSVDYPAYQKDDLPKDDTTSFWYD